MKRKNAIIIAVLLTAAAGAFIAAYLYDFQGAGMKHTEKLQHHDLWLYLLMTGFTLMPCFAMGVGRIYCLWGFLPPALLNYEMWLLLLSNIKRIESMKGLTFSPGHPAVIGMSILAGFFGILITCVTTKIISGSPPKEKNGKPAGNEEKRAEESPAGEQEQDENDGKPAQIEDESKEESPHTNEPMSEGNENRKDH